MSDSMHKMDLPKDSTTSAVCADDIIVSGANLLLYIIQIVPPHKRILGTMKKNVQLKITQTNDLVNI